jgi:hypothetical protein
MKKRLRRLQDLRNRHAIAEQRLDTLRVRLEEASSVVHEHHYLPNGEAAREYLAKVGREVEEHYLLVRSFDEHVTLAELGWTGQLHHGQGIRIEINGRDVLVGISQDTGIASIDALTAEAAVVHEIMRRTDFLIGDPGARRKYRLGPTGYKLIDDKQAQRAAAVLRSRQKLAETLKDRIIEVAADAMDPLKNPAYNWRHGFDTPWQNYVKRELGKDVFQMWKRDEVKLPHLGVSFADVSAMTPNIRNDYLLRARKEAESWAGSLGDLVSGTKGTIGPDDFELARVWRAMKRQDRDALILAQLEKLEDPLLRELELAQAMVKAADEYYGVANLESRIVDALDALNLELADFVKGHEQYALQYMELTGADLDITLFDEVGYKAAVEEAERLIRYELNKGEALFGEVEEFIDAMIGGMWEETQRQIKFVGGPPAPDAGVARIYAQSYAKKAGYDVVVWADGERTLIHGIRGRTSKARILVEGTDEFVEAVGVRALESEYASVYRPTDHIVLIRGMKPSAEDAERVASFLGRVRTVQWQPGSSFTFSPLIGANFSSIDLPRRGYVTIAFVPKAKILATSRTGFGCFGENECIMLGGPMTTLNMLQPSEHVHLQWWDFLHRLGVTGLADVAELEAWRRFANSVRSPLKDRFTPDADQAALLGWRRIESEDLDIDFDEEGLFEEAYEVFSEQMDTSEFGTYFDDVVKYDESLFDDAWIEYSEQIDSEMIEALKGVLDEDQLLEWDNANFDFEWVENEAWAEWQDLEAEWRQEWFDNLKADDFWDDDKIREGFWEWYQETYFDEWYHDEFLPRRKAEAGVDTWIYEPALDPDDPAFSGLETHREDPWADPADLSPPTSGAFDFTGT